VPPWSSSFEVSLLIWSRQLAAGPVRLFWSTVTNDPSLTIDPDDNDDDLELYGAPVQPPIKPRFIDVARLTNAWCQHYPETAQRGNRRAVEHQNVDQIEDDGHQRLAYPSPLRYERFDPVVYPIPWDNNPVPEHLREQPPRGCHEETTREPQNEAGSSTRTDEATPEARGNLPPWRHLPGGFYEWYMRPGWFDQEQPGDEENVLERGSNEDDDRDCLVTRAHRYKRGS
jgi:hypothetical protein